MSITTPQTNKKTTLLTSLVHFVLTSCTLIANFMLTRNLSFTEPFPGDILLEIRGYPGNDRCCDCASLDTDWCSISHGTLICLECAGKHRSLGVLVSFVRSIHMDSWSRQQVCYWYFNILKLSEHVIITSNANFLLF